MRGSVFIGWSSSNNLAKMVKTELVKEGYVCVVGGSDDLVGSLSIADTIVNQISAASQSVFIIRKNEKGSISNNVTFEIGYSVSKYNSTLQKLHLFYLDIDPKDDSIPSDLLGLWATHISTEGKSDKEVVDEIVRSFISHQKTELVENKMDLMTNWVNLYMMLTNHLSTPNHSDFDIAQYMLIYIESTADAHAWSESREMMKKYEIAINEDSTELYYAINLYQTADGIMNSRQFDGLHLYINKTEMRNYRGKLKLMIDKVTEYSTDPNAIYQIDPMFAKWFVMIAKYWLQFAYMLQTNDPEIAEKDPLFNKAKVLDEEILILCDELARADPLKNKEILWQYEYIAHRHLAVIANYFKDMKKLEDECQLSYRCTSQIHNKYKGKIDYRVAETLEREYYMSLAGIMPYMDDDDREDAKDEIAEYVDRMLHIRDSNTVYINRLKLYIEGRGISGL